MEHDRDSRGQAGSSHGRPERAPTNSPVEGPLVWKALVLLGPRREAIIEYEGQEYRLRLTSNNKLILTK